MEAIPSPLECSSDFLDNEFTDCNRNFVKALQELKGLRPQLYSAAEYCEKNYYCSEQKERVVEDLKDYTVQALVNAVDHLGTVASKLTDILEYQTSEISSAELKLLGLNQQILTCRMVVEGEGLRQQQRSVSAPHGLHKRYILPTFDDSKEPSVVGRGYIPMYSKATPSDSLNDPRPLSWFLGPKQNQELKTTKSDFIRSVPTNFPSSFFPADTERSIQRTPDSRTRGIVQHVVLKPEEKGMGRRGRLAAFFGKHRA